MAHPRHRRCQSLLHDEAGAVYAEAVIMLPVFLTILGLLYLVKDTYEAHMETMAIVRSEAWIYSNSACEQSPQRSSVQKRSVTDIFADAVGAVSGAQSSIDTAFHSEDDGEDDPSEIPVVDDLLNSIFGDGFYAISPTVEVRGQALLGPMSQNVANRYALACNPAYKTFWDVI